MDPTLLDILACPVCKGQLSLDRKAMTLDCAHDRLAFPVRQGIPVMLADEAIDLADKAASATVATPATPATPGVASRAATGSSPPRHDD